jgi:hypothetical protein
MVQETVKMKYGYMTYANLLSEWFEKMDDLPAEMDRFKEHAEKHGFHMKYWGHPYGTSENIVAVFKSEKGLGDWQIMNQAYTQPYDGDRTVLAVRA